MDFGTVIGLIGSMVLMVISIMIAGDIRAFWDTPSVVIVFGGAILTVMTSVPMGLIFNFPRVLMRSIFVQEQSYRKLVARIVELAVVARRDGILALESYVDENCHPFLAAGLRMAVDGTDPELIEKLMNAEIESLSDRHKKGKTVCDLIAKYAPAYGMIGTLIGLVIMLGNMSDPSAIGPGMACALLTTLYGAVLSKAVFLPLSDKLAYYSRQELMAANLILQGVLAIQSGDNPRIVEQKLLVYLPPWDRAAPAK